MTFYARTWSVAVAVLVPGVLLLTGCGDPEGSAMTPRCGGVDHPCTLAEVSDAAIARREALDAALLERMQDTRDHAELAAWLSEQPDVVEAGWGPEAIRYRVRGGRGHWLFFETAASIGRTGGMAQAATSPGQTGASLSRARPFRDAGRPRADDAGKDSILGPILAGGLEWLVPPAHAQAPGRQIKRALLLSPFRWQWQLEGLDDGIEDIRKALQARDYEDRVDVRVDAIDPEDPGITTGGIGLPDVTNWKEYDYIHLLTHGGRVCNPLGHCMTAVMTPWTEDLVASARAGAEAAGNADLLQQLDRVGQETAKIQLFVPADEIPELGPGQVYQENTIDGSVRTLTGPFVLLTSQFFIDTYGGLDDSVVVISACSSGVDGDLLSGLQGDNTAVIGWRSTMSLRAAAAAGGLIARTLVEADETLEDDSGLTVGQAMQRIRDRLDDLATDPPDHQDCADPQTDEMQARCDIASNAQVLGVINDMPADRITGSSLRVIGDETVRAREIVYLVDDEGEELADGSALDVVGMPQDGDDDAVDLTIRTDGLRLEEDPGDVELEVEFEGRTIEIDKRLEREVADGVWELDYRLPLERDHERGERVDLELVGNLPDGNESRWLYRDLLLGGCRSREQGDFSGMVSGGVSLELELGRSANFAKLFIGRGPGAGRLQISTGRRGDYRFNLNVPIDSPPESGAEYRVEDGGFSGDLRSEIGGGYNRREGRDDNWHSGTATVHLEMVEWDDQASPRANRRGWACGRVRASLTAIADPPPGAHEPVYTPYTIELDFMAEITRAAGR